MHLPREQLDDRVQQLNRFRSTLVERMRNAATLLLSPGVGPDEDLETSFEDYSLQLKSLQFDLDLDSTAEGPVWGPIETRLDSIRRSEIACGLLAPIDQLRVLSGDPSLVKPVQDAADDVRNRLQDSPWQHVSLLEEIEERRHPLCRLIHLLEAPEALTDEDWTTEMTFIQEQFGTPVSTAVARGRVQLVARESQE